MKYRKSILQDSQEIYSLICDLENRELPYDAFDAIYHDQISDGHYYCLVCEQRGKVVGMLNMRFEEQLHHTERIAEILEFAIDESCRNMGIGKEMFEQSCQIAVDNGCSQIEVACNQLRKDTHRFYEREGMHNFHFKFSKRLANNDSPENILGR